MEMKNAKLGRAGLALLKAIAVEEELLAMLWMVEDRAIRIAL